MIQIDMEMPKYCGINECPLCTLGWRDKNGYTEWCHRPNGNGFVMVGHHSEENKIPDDCPLMEAKRGESATDLISRQEAMDAVDSETVSTNPEHYKSSEKFIKFMDDADIASFGKWQWANGFNTGVIAAMTQIKKLPPTQPPVGAIPIDYMRSQVDSGKWEEIITRWKEHEKTD